MNLRPGDRIRLIEMPNDPAPIEPGSEGVVGYIHEGLASRDDALGSDQISVKWDGGRTLALCVPPDRFEVIGHEDVPEPWASIYRTEGGAK